MAVVTTYDTFLVVVAEREIVIDLLCGTAQRQLVVLYGSIVVEKQVLPVGIGGHIVRIGIARSLSCIHQSLVLHDHIACSVEHIAVLPGRLPTL